MRGACSEKGSCIGSSAGLPLCPCVPARKVDAAIAFRYRCIRFWLLLPVNVTQTFISRASSRNWPLR